MKRGRRAALALPFAASLACAAPTDPEIVDRQYQPLAADYRAFRDRLPEVLEPNYLPFMVHRLSFGPGERDALVFCRWDDEAFPLPVFVETPVLDDQIEDEFAPVDPARYAESVAAALGDWERELDGLVSFRRVSDPSDAALRLVLLGERAPSPIPEVQVLGSTRLGGACRYRAGAVGADRLDLSFSVPELRIFVADQFGLLTPEQVGAVARHEIGHALGMPAHSPIPADLMYEIVRDRIQVQAGLSEEDVHSFTLLYRLPAGTVFAWVPRGGQPERPPVAPVPAEPRLAMAPHVDARLGFEIRLPEGWVRLASQHGVAAADGVTWDYRGSFQVVVAPYDDIGDYLRRYGSSILAGSRVLARSRVVVAGRPALRLVLLRPEERTEELTFIASGDGRVFHVIADAPSEDYDAYRSWFWAALTTLEIWPAEAGRPAR